MRALLLLLILSACWLLLMADPREGSEAMTGVACTVASPITLYVASLDPMTIEHYACDTDTGLYELADVTTGAELTAHESDTTSTHGYDGSGNLTVPGDNLYVGSGADNKRLCFDDGTIRCVSWNDSQGRLELSEMFAVAAGLPSFMFVDTDYTNAAVGLQLSCTGADGSESCVQQIQTRKAGASGYGVEIGGGTASPIFKFLRSDGAGFIGYAGAGETDDRRIYFDGAEGYVFRQRATVKSELNTYDVTTFADLDTTPSVAGGVNFKTGNTILTTITDFDDGGTGTLATGDTIFVLANDTLTILDCTASGIRCNGGSDRTMTSGDSTVCVYDGTDWWCR